MWQGRALRALKAFATPATLAWAAQVRDSGGAWHSVLQGIAKEGAQSDGNKAMALATLFGGSEARAQVERGKWVLATDKGDVCADIVRFGRQWRNRQRRDN